MSQKSNPADIYFQLKADFIPITVLRLKSSDLTAIANQLEKTIATAPKYFHYTPLVIDVGQVSNVETELDLLGLLQFLRSKQIVPMGVQGLLPGQESLAWSQNLAVLKNKSNSNPEVKIQNKETKKETDSIPSSAHNLIVTKPVRAGTQVYAKGGDLIILAAVNAGAECLADGNIHIYAPLRGRAMAGVNGNIHARIFCQSLQAELVAIAGYYMVSEQMQTVKQNSGMLQIYLSNERLQISNL